MGFMLLYAAGGRKIAVPYGVAITQNPWLIILITTAADTLQIPLFFFIYSAGKKVVFFRRIRINLSFEESKIKRHAIWGFVRNLGCGGIFLLSMLPSFGGGVWSSVLLAFILKTRKKTAYALIALGSFIGIVLLAFFSQGIIQGIISLLR
ncbi:MAG: small multi-drug export protein [archaeon]